jgi:hypothetical protein
MSDKTPTLHSVIGKGVLGYPEGWLCCNHGDARDAYKADGVLDVGEIRYHIHAVEGAGRSGGRAEALGVKPNVLVASIHAVCGDGDWYCSDECLADHAVVLDRQRTARIVETQIESRNLPTHPPTKETPDTAKTETYVAISFPAPDTWDRDSEPFIEAIAPTMELAKMAVYTSMVQYSIELAEGTDDPSDVEFLDWDETDDNGTTRAYCEELDLRLKIQRLSNA